MNYRGSYRHLLRNAQSALLAAIEVYNKPRFEYRDECFVILLLNAWELILKAVLSKHRQPIFYPKKRREPYRTLALNDALVKAEKFFPKDLPALPIRRNVQLLDTYRNNAVHFYNKPGFGSVVYGLAQASIVNFKDLLRLVFSLDLGREITWTLLPLGLRAPIDPIDYISKGTKGVKKEGAAVMQFLTELGAATREVQDAGSDAGRLLTVFTVKLESTKKLEKADVVVGVEASHATSGPLAIVKTSDPNKTHPLRQKEVLASIATLHGQPFTAHTFQAVVWKHRIKEHSNLCWQATEGVLTRYSRDLISWIRQLSAADIQAALTDYRDHLRSKSQAATKA
jgi:uncharacterized protein DUF3644